MIETQYALIRNSLVENIIIADDDFVKLIQGDWDSIIQVNHPDGTAPQTAIGWKYDNSEFISPSVNQLEVE